MMHNASDQKNIDPPKPGKTITFLEGEILSVKISQWGTNGKLSTKFGIFNYRLKDSSSFSNNILVGLKLTINNGYCFESKQGELVVSDGKFGNIKTEIDMNLLQSYTKQNIIITGKITSIEQRDETTVLIFELFLPSHTNQEIKIKSNSSNFEFNSKKFHEMFFGKIVKLQGSGTYQAFEVNNIESLPKNHFLNMITEIEKDNLEAFTAFNHIITNQIQHIENIHNSFKNTFINMGKKISKSLLTELKEVLLDKILNGSVKSPYNILIPHSDINEYFDTMLTFLRNIISSEETSSNPEELVTILKYHYPVYSRQNVVKNEE